MTNASYKTQVEYAAHRGVSKQAIHKLRKAGKLRMAGRMVDVAASDLELDESRERVRVAPSSGATLTKAKTATEVIRARTAQLNYEALTGRLVPVEDVHAEARLLAESLVHVFGLALLRIDDLFLAAGGGIGEFRLALKQLERDMRTEGSQAFTKVAITGRQNGAARFDGLDRCGRTDAAATDHALGVGDQASYGA